MVGQTVSQMVQMVPRTVPMVPRTVPMVQTVQTGRRMDPPSQRSSIRKRNHSLLEIYTTET